MAFDPDKYLAEVEKKKAEFDPDAYLASVEEPEAGADYQQPQSQTSMFLESATEALPIIGGMIGGAAASPGVVTGAAGGALGYGLGKAAENYLKQEFFGKEMTPREVVTEPLMSIPEGFAQELGVGLALKGMQKAAPALLKAEDYFLNKAGRLAENATGATAVQAEKFKPGSGVTLLKEGIVGAFDDAESIARKAAQKMTQQERAIDQSLKFVDEKGIMVSADKIANKLEQKAAEVAQDPSRADVARKLQTIVNDIYMSGNSLVTASKAEATKRGFNKVARNWLDPQQGEAGKIAYRAYRDAVEEAAEEAGVSNTFKQAKEMFGTLAPIEAAASRRALQLNQSPAGGLLDMASAGVGAGAGGVFGAIALPAARRFASPRLTSTAAKSVYGLSKIPAALAKGTESGGSRVLLSPISAAVTQPIIEKIMPELFTPPPETNTQKAERLNEERKLLKGK